MTLRCPTILLLCSCAQLRELYKSFAPWARAEFQEGVYREMEHSMVNKRAETELALFTCVQHVRNSPESLVAAVSSCADRPLQCGQQPSSCHSL